MGGSHRSSLPRRAGERGFVLIALIALLAMGALYLLVSNLTPEAIEARRQAKTEAALVQAREALIGYALQYRDQQIATGTLDAMYGFLPMPDVGTSRFNAGQQNPACNTEGCAMSFVNGAFPSTTATVVGRLPWRTLGTGPLLDGYGECLWYIVSANFKSLGMDANAAMNWDTLGQIDIVTTNDTANLQSLIANAHNRPVAIIFSPGPLLGSQVRGQIGSDVVTECGGNYIPANYLEPSLATALLDNTGLAPAASAYFSGATSTDTSLIALAISTQGKIVSDGTNLNKACPSGTNCSLVANDIGLPITSETLFGALRKSSNFRTDINSMLDRMSTCLRDQFAFGSFTLDANSTGLPASPADKTAGRIPASTCYDDTQNPLGYFSHYKDQVFVAKPVAGTWDNTVTVDGVAQASCSGTLIFGSQRGAGQSRSTTTERNTPANYLEGANLTGFITTGTPSFAGPSLFAQVSASQTASQDIVRCIPASASMSLVTSQPLANAGFGQLVAYDTATRTLTLGKQDVTTGFGAPGAALFGCAWLADSHSLNNGFRSYFSFQFKKVGTNVGSNGFVFAIADAVNNSLASCGAAGSHLGYSGDNGATPKVKFPKIGIEFDQSKNAGFPNTSSGQSSTNAGRNDPCYTCFPTNGTADTHAAIVYWGHESANATDSVILPDFDDNVHGFPTAAALAGNLRPPPTNPAVSSPGLQFVNLRGYPTNAYDSRLFYVRVEITPFRNVNTSAAELSNTSVRTEVWIESNPNFVNQIAALKNTTRPMTQLYPAGYGSTINDTAVMYDVPVAGSSCNATTPCPATQACGTDGVCYRPALQTLKLGFTGSQRTADQQVNISDLFTTWLP